MAKIARPVLRYPGGKYLIADWVIRYFPPHNLYVEPFAGAASVLLAKPRSNGEIYNDLDGDVVNVFRVLRDVDQAKQLERLLRLTPFALDEYKACWEASDDPIEKARRMIFRSFAGIGSDSLFRANGFRYSKHNKSGVVPAQAWAKYPDVISEFTKRLQGVIINNLDAIEIIKKYDGPETLFYLDPPYLSSTRAGASIRYSNELDTDIQHRELSKLLLSIKGKVVLSGYDSDLYLELYKGWSKQKKTAKAHQGAVRTECLWLSPNIQPMFFERM